MKKLLLLTILCAFSLLSIAQVKFNTMIMYGNNNAAIPGGENGKQYAAIIKSDLSKKAIVDKTTKFLLKYDLVSAKDIHLDEISQETSEYSIPFCFTQTQFYSSMRVVTPVRLYGTLRFEFYKGGVLLVAENMRTTVLCVSYHGTVEERGGAYKSFMEEGNALQMTKSFLGKALIWANTTKEERAEFYKNTADYFDNLQEKIDVYNLLAKSGEAKWMNAQELCDYTKENPSPGSKYMVTWLENTAIPANLLLEINKKRWEKQIREEYFDKLFILLANFIDGYIEGVKEDETQTWSLEDNILLPTDVKERANFKKKHKDFYSK